MKFEDLNPDQIPTTPLIDANLLILFERVKLVEANWVYAGHTEFICTSGLRSAGHQLSLIAQGLSNATKSRHLTGRACDVSDKDGHIKKWLKENPNVLPVACLWCEDANHTPTWVHFQTVAPGSGKRWFIP